MIGKWNPILSTLTLSLSPTSLLTLASALSLSLSPGVYFCILSNLVFIFHSFIYYLFSCPILFHLFILSSDLLSPILSILFPFTTVSYPIPMYSHPGCPHTSHLGPFPPLCASPPSLGQRGELRGNPGIWSVPSLHHPKRLPRPPHPQ